MEREPKQQKTRRKFTHKEVQKRRIFAGILGTVAILTGASFLPNNNSGPVNTDRTYQAAPKLNEIPEQGVSSDIRVSGINWTSDQRTNGAIGMISNGNTRYIEAVLPTKSPVNKINQSDISVTLENRVGFPINPEGGTTTIGKNGENITIQITYQETNTNFESTTSRILNEPTTIGFTDNINGQTYYFGVNPNA